MYRLHFGIPMTFKLFFLFMTVAMLAAACGSSETTSSTADAGSAETPFNFQFLISDDVNAIDQFSSLLVTISRIGLQQGGESGKWIEVPPQVPTVDLTLLQGENALSIWSGTVPDGVYTKVFVYVDSVQGVLASDPGQFIDVKLPSNKLQLSKTFEIAPDAAPVSFVYDLTVIAAGNPKSGIKYILKPQIGESGSDQRFKEVGSANAAGGPETRGELAFQLEGDVIPGGVATVTLTYQGIPLSGVLLGLDDDELGTTDALGQLSIRIPLDTDEVELETELEGKLKIEYAEGVPLTSEVKGEKRPSRQSRAQLTQQEALGAAQRKR